MWLESVVTFMKTLPTWLMHVAEVLFVAVMFMTAVTFLMGIWCGLRIVGKRANSIREIQVFPPKIIFQENKDSD